MYSLTPCYCAHSHNVLTHNVTVLTVIMYSLMPCYCAHLHYPLFLLQSKMESKLVHCDTLPSSISGLSHHDNPSVEKEMKTVDIPTSLAAQLLSLASNKSVDDPHMADNGAQIYNSGFHLAHKLSSASLCPTASSPIEHVDGHVQSCRNITDDGWFVLYASFMFSIFCLTHTNTTTKWCFFMCPCHGCLLRATVVVLLQSVYSWWRPYYSVIDLHQ